MTLDDVRRYVLSAYGITKEGAEVFIPQAAYPQNLRPEGQEAKDHLDKQNVTEALQSHDLRDPATPGSFVGMNNPLGVFVGGPSK